VQIQDAWAGYLQVRLDARDLIWRNTIPWEDACGPHRKCMFGRPQQLLY
jgi:hypothetical protein